MEILCLDLKDLKKNGGISGSGTIKIDFKTCDAKPLVAIVNWLG